MTLQNFYLTFGVQYPEVPHPTWDKAHKDGWVTIEARDMDEAEHVAALYFGQYFSFVYAAPNFNEEDMKRRFYPLGELVRLRVGEWPPPAGGPTPRFSAHDPEFYGVDSSKVVATRIVGTLKDALDETQAEYFHPECATNGAGMFAIIMERDDYVRAFELDWAVPYPCPVCRESIT
jgi:hypothetical protein